MAWEIIASGFIGYLFGNFNFAYILGKLKGFDIRKEGSGNPGTTNAVITMGYLHGAFVLICDVSKAIAAFVVAYCLFKKLIWLGAFSAFMALIGHCFPFYMRFKGGMGLASLLGLTCSITSIEIFTAVIILYVIQAAIFIFAIKKPQYVTPIAAASCVAAAVFFSAENSYIIFGVLGGILVFINSLALFTGKSNGLNFTFDKIKDKVGIFQGVMKKQ